MGQLDLLEPLPPGEAPRKSDSAYKTISEVSDELEVPQHVLRFWETHFPQVKPSRMRGDRRYYRPEDVDALKRIKTLLYSQGYTIKGAKKAIRSKQPVPDASALPPKAAPAPKKKASPETKAVANELKALQKMLATVL